MSDTASDGADLVVAGGGFAGLWAALAARRALVDAGQQRHTVVVVSRDPFLTLRPRLYEGRESAYRTPIAPALEAAGVRLVIGEIVGFAVDGQRCLLADGRTLEWGALVLATGSRVRPLVVPGAERLLDIDTFAGAVAFDARLADRRGSAAVVIVGAGFTGIELATRLGKGGNGTRVTLVDRAPVVGAALGEGPRPEIERALAHTGVTCRLGVAVASIGRNSVRFDDGSDIAADLVVNCGGLVASALTAGFPGRIDPLGRLEVNDDLRVTALERVWAGGDVAAARVDTAGQPSLMSCQHALTMGRFAGHNAASDLLGLPTRPYRQPRYVTCLALGDGDAVFTEGWERRVTLTGEDAARVKERINGSLIYPPDGAAETVLAQAAPPD